MEDFAMEFYEWNCGLLLNKYAMLNEIISGAFMMF